MKGTESMATKHEVSILLVEDDPGHARLIEKNLRRSKINNPLIIIDDGAEALDYLLCQGDYAGQTRPSPLLVLLDLNLPGMDGYQVLEQMKNNPETRRIPVIILTTTDDYREVERCYQLGCNVYITKPVDYEQFADAISKLGLFLTIVTIPDGD